MKEIRSPNEKCNSPLGVFEAEWYSVLQLTPNREFSSIDSKHLTATAIVRSVETKAFLL